MPYIRVQTNQNVVDAGTFLKGLSAVSADSIGKPEKYIQTALDADTDMTFGGTADPTAFVECKSIGLTEADTKSVSAALSGYCESELSIPVDRIYIEFTGAKGSMWGWNGGTF